MPKDLIYLTSGLECSWDLSSWYVSIQLPPAKARIRGMAHRDCCGLPRNAHVRRRYAQPRKGPWRDTPPAKGVLRCRLRHRQPDPEGRYERLNCSDFSPFSNATIMRLINRISNLIVGGHGAQSGSALGAMCTKWKPIRSCDYGQHKIGFRYNWRLLTSLLAVSILYK